MHSLLPKVLLVDLLCSKGISKPGVIAQLVKGLPCKHENLSLVPRTHLKIHKTPENKNKQKNPHHHHHHHNKKPEHGVGACVWGMGVRQVDPWHSQPGLISEFQASERPCPKRQVNGTSKQYPVMFPTSTRTHRQIWPHVPVHTQLHTHELVTCVQVHLTGQFTEHSFSIGLSH